MRGYTQDLSLRIAGDMIVRVLRGFFCHRTMAHFVYILASFRGAIYTGSTNHLVRRLEQYCSRAAKSFSSTYKTTKLVYVEAADSAEVALARERQIKGWRRNRKVELIESINPYWEDLWSQVMD